MSQVIVSDTFDDVENDKHFLYLIKRYLTTTRHIIFLRSTSKDGDLNVLLNSLYHLDWLNNTIV